MSTKHQDTMPFHLPCYDIMEIVGTHVETIRKDQEYNNNYNHCITTLNDVFRNGVLRDTFDREIEGYIRHEEDDWLGYIADNSDDVFVLRFYTCPDWMVDD